MPEDEPSQDRIDQLISRLDYLERALREQTTRLYYIEQRLGLVYHPSQTQPVHPTAPQPPIAAPASPAVPVQTSPIPPPAVTAQPVTQPIASQAQTATHTPFAQTRRVSSRPGPDLETRIGGSWLMRIGMIAISIGIAFFLKLAIDSDWIGPRGQVLIGACIGIGFVIAGERLRLRYANYAYGLTGGGILILYLSIYAAFAFYELIPQEPAFVLMAIVTAMAALLSARYSALPIAVLSLIGGFLTPFLLSTGTNNEVGLFGYIALLDAGVLALAYRKQWRSLNYMAFVATALTIAAWMFRYYKPEALWLTIFFLTLFFAIFATVAVLYNIVNRRPIEWEDLVLVFANALGYFGASYDLLDDNYHGLLGLFAVLMSAFYLALGYITYRRDREDRLLVHTFLGLAFLFAVLAMPIQFDQHWVTMGWAIEGAVMTWVGLKASDRVSRYAGLVVFVIAAFHWLSTDVIDFSYGADASFIPFINRRALSCAVLVAALVCAAWLYKRFGQDVDKGERSTFMGLYTIGANMLVLTIASLDINGYFQQLKAGAPPAEGNFNLLQSYMGWSELDNARQLVLSLLWISYGLVALAVGVMRDLAALRWWALALLALATVKVMAVDSQYYSADWNALVFNYTFASFALLIIALSVSVWLYSRAERASEAERSLILPMMIIIANLAAVMALSLEAYGHFERRTIAGEEAGDDSRLARQLSLSVIWTVYGGALLVLGIAKRELLLRVMALVLLAVTIVKVFLVDMASLRTIYRIISFIVLGGVLLAVSFLYQRYRQRLEEILGDEEEQAPAQSA
ncbi:MAG TPA: DUF2339 domain-containing protein [Blastocatellia bacterium]|nr:DUF2339 domain-containing protein [Blastocatellia bacterium]